MPWRSNEIGPGETMKKAQVNNEIGPGEEMK
jgi:hypothetical protein